MKNKNGQALVMFVILIPVLIMIMAFTVDTWVIYNRKNEVNNIIGSETQKEKIENALERNNIDNYSLVEKPSCIEINLYVESIFGKFVLKDGYQIKIEKCK